MEANEIFPEESKLITKKPDETDHIIRENGLTLKAPDDPEVRKLLKGKMLHSLRKITKT